MLNENIQRIRREKGLSQEELAIKIHVVRQTVSKWEKGLSVPDSDLLIALSEALETPVGVLLGETVTEREPDDLKAIAQKLEVLNLQLASRKETGRKIAHYAFIALALLILALGIVLFFLQSPYLSWNYEDPETAVLGTAFHSFEWIFFRTAPFFLAGAAVGAILTRKRA